MTSILLTLFACKAPHLDLWIPAGPVRGPVEIGVDSNASWVELESTEGPLELDAQQVLIEGLPDGEHVITARAGGFLRPTTTTTATIVIDNTAPMVSLSPRSRTVEQGHTLPFVFETDESATVALTLLERERPLYAIGDRRWRALVGVPIRQEPGTLTARLQVTDRLGNTATHDIPVEVTPVDWPFTGTLRISKKKASVPSPAIEKMRGERDPVYAEHTPDALWAGRMPLPTEGRHTSYFGSYRQYPDGHRSHHDAQDIANKTGTPVYAANDGVIRIARKQAIHGNAVLLAHGQGIVTLYSHLNRFDVSEGDVVKKGDKLGEMGTTGRSTGPHLHWGIVVDHVPVDPMQWTEQTFDADAFEDFEPLP